MGASMQGVELGPFQAYAAMTENASNFSLHNGKQERSRWLPLTSVAHNTRQYLSQKHVWGYSIFPWKIP